MGEKAAGASNKRTNAARQCRGNRPIPHAETVGTNCRTVVSGKRARFAAPVERIPRSRPIARPSRLFVTHWLLLVLLALLWGPSFMFIKIGLRDIPPLSLAAGRIVLAALVLFGMMRLARDRFPSEKGFWRKFLIMGFFANSLPFALLMWGETKTSSALASIFNGFTPVATALIANFTIPDEKLTGRTLWGVLTGFGGIFLLFLPAFEKGVSESTSFPGYVAFTLIAVSYAISMVYARHALRGYPRFVAPAAQLIGASVLLAPVALLADWNALRMPGLESLGALFWLGIVATALAYVVYYRLLEIAGATYISLVTFLLPPIGIILGVFILDESIQWNAIAGCALILLGVGFVRNRPGEKRREEHVNEGGVDELKDG